MLLHMNGNYFQPRNYGICKQVNHSIHCRRTWVMLIGFITFNCFRLHVYILIKAWWLQTADFESIACVDLRSRVEINIDANCVINGSLISIGSLRIAKNAIMLLLGAWWGRVARFDGVWRFRLRQYWTDACSMRCFCCAINSY